MALERVRDRWEAMPERERRLLVILSVTIIIGGLGAVGMMIRDGLTSIEDKNELTRDALRSIAQHRIKAEMDDGRPDVLIPDESPKLSRYLEEKIKALELTSPSYPQEKEHTKGGYTESAFQVRLNDLTVYQLKDLLEKIETANRAVIVKELQVRQKSRREKEKLTVTMTVATYRNAKKKASADDEGGGEEQDEEADEGEDS